MLSVRALLTRQLPFRFLRVMSGAKAYSTSDLLINDAKYSWLQELGLQAENPGVFDGTWHGSGSVCAMCMWCVLVCAY